MKEINQVHFTLGDNAGILLMQIAQEALLCELDPEKAVKVITTSLMGCPNNIALKILKGDMVCEVTDDNYVLMEKLDFDLLPDYTNSEPTGKYNGKMWKGRFQTLKGEKWFLMWCHDENKLSNQIYISSREILVL